MPYIDKTKTLLGILDPGADSGSIPDAHRSQSGAI